MRNSVLSASALASALGVLAALTTPVMADCSSLPGFAKVQAALKASTKPSGGESNGGLDLNMWASVVDRDGTVCVVAFTGKDRGAQWPGSRVISAQKANTANAFSLDSLALSTANLFSAVQPGGSLYGLQHSNPVDTAVGYGGDSRLRGTARDPMVGKKIGGVNVFGGGLALYDKSGVIGAVGVSGDTSCADHNVAWRVRKALGLNNVPGGVSPNKDDGVIYDIANGSSKSGFGHPTCGGKEVDVAVSIGAGAR
jgi:uncharacterized protein GlcG (DUF336 family)